MIFHKLKNTITFRIKKLKGFHLNISLIDLYLRPGCYGFDFVEITAGNGLLDPSRSLLGFWYSRSNFEIDFLFFKFVIREEEYNGN